MDKALDKGLDRAMEKLEQRFGQLVTELNELDGRLDRMIAAQEETNSLLRQLNEKIDARLSK